MKFFLVQYLRCNPTVHSSPLIPELHKRFPSNVTQHELSLHVLLAWVTQHTQTSTQYKNNTPLFFGAMVELAEILRDPTIEMWVLLEQIARQEALLVLGWWK